MRDGPDAGELPRDYYEVLGVEPDASREDVKRAYRDLARELHPDHHVGASEEAQRQATRAFAEVAEAWACLSNPSRRAAYDKAIADPSERDDFALDDCDVGDWLVRAAFAATLNMLEDEIDEELFTSIARVVFIEMLEHAPATLKRSSVAAASTEAYRAALAANQAWVAPPPGTPIAVASGLALCLWGAAHWLRSMVPQPERDRLPAAPSEPGFRAPPPGRSSTAESREDGSHGRSEPTRETDRAPAGQRRTAWSGPACEVCGQGPTRAAEFHVLRGRILWFTYAHPKATLCRACGLSIGRECQSTTLNHGWWGVFSAFLTPLALAINGQRILNFASLPLPSPGTSVDARISLDPGTPVLKRGVVGVVAFAILATIAAFTVDWDEANGGNSGYSPSGSYGATYEPAVVPWSVGNCIVEVGMSAYPVSCSEPNDGRIVSASFSADRCPSYTDAYGEGSEWYCVR